MEGKVVMRTVLLLFFFHYLLADPSLSPATWPPGIMDDLNKLENYFGIHPQATSDGKGVVTGTMNAMAIYAGIDALNKGGNAMDACLAGSMAQVTLVAGAYVSYAGIANILYFDNTTKQVTNFNGEWNQLLNPVRNSDLFVPHGDPAPSGVNVLTPGFFAAVNEAAKLAKFQLSTLLEPSIYFSQEGFLMNQILYDNIASNANNGTLFRTQEGIDTFINPATNQLYQIGELFKQPNAAQFLFNISVNGVEYVYQGDWANQATNAVIEEDGFWTLDDFAAYQASTPLPYSTTFLDIGTVYTVGAPNIGGVCVIQSINVMELALQQNYLDTISPYGTNGTSMYWMIEISRVVYIISQISVSVANSTELFEELLSINTTDQYRVTKESALELWNLMISPGGMDSIRRAFRIIFMMQYDFADDSNFSVGKHSDGMIAVDSNGNVCSMVHSANAYPFGTGIMVQGVILPSGASTYPSETLLQPPGVRMPNLPEPLIFLDQNSKPILAISVVGSSLMEFTQQMFFISTVLSKGPQDSIQSPLYYTIDLYPILRPRYQQVFTGIYSDEVIQTIEDLGQPIQVYDQTYLSGFATQVSIDPSTNVMTAATNSLANGFAFGI